MRVIIIGITGILDEVFNLIKPVGCMLCVKLILIFFVLSIKFLVIDLERVRKILEFSSFFSFPIGSNLGPLSLTVMLLYLGEINVFVALTLLDLSIFSKVIFVCSKLINGFGEGSLNNRLILDEHSEGSDSS